MVAEFWNIPKGLISVFYVFAFATVIIFVLGFWDKMRIWSKGMDVDHELKGMGPAGLIWLSIIKFFSPDCLLAKRLFPRSFIRGLILVGIMWGFHPAFFRNGRQKCKLLYVPISRWRCLASFFSAARYCRRRGPRRYRLRALPEIHR